MVARTYTVAFEGVEARIVEVQCAVSAGLPAFSVVGLPDKKFGEELCAWIVPREGETLTEDEVRDFCKGQIAHYKVPRYIKFVDGFPMTVTGKIQKFLIRDQMKQELGLEENKTA